MSLYLTKILASPLKIFSPWHWK